MDKKLERILEESYVVYGVRTVSQHLYNEGLNKEHLEHEKIKLITDCLKENVDDIIDTTMFYPKDDIQDFQLEMDLIMIPRKELDKILSE